MSRPLVAIVGRPNVGKSTFFNKISGKRISIVEDTPGVTRDRVYADVEWLGRKFTLIDTGGIDPRSEDVLLKQMRRQAEIAMDTADVICFFTDARAGLTQDDQEVAELLRKTRKPLLLVVNKVDHAGLNDDVYEFYNLGLGDPISISSVNMLGLGDLLEEIVKLLPPADPEEEDEAEHVVQLAVVGRPNVGKSSLVNRLLGKERVMVSNIPGTTRDAIDSRFTAPDGTEYNIIDTAGIRRKRVIEDESLERYSVLRSIAAIKRCDVALMLIDAQDGVTEQDTKIAGLVHEEGKACVVVVNKWDAIEKETNTMEQYRKQVLEDLKFMDYAPVLFVSAMTGQRVHTVLDMVSQAYAQYTKRVPTGVLNDVLADAQASLQPPATNGRRLKIYYGTQQHVAPPTFILFVNDEELMHFAYQRYLENFLRKTFDFTGTPIRLVLRAKHKEE
ncbi:MAG TPA: ribosome biogenesis GTPase Der [Candidatus Egerieenecus merdigallinarum]|nr:ribosome biogenesis GTPase Der [Candidatus Egerieenecus merdigallinarum]